MANDYVQPGETITGIAPYNVASGAGALLGSHLFGVALSTVLSGAQTEFRLVGVWDLACLSTDVPAFGALLYWDNTNKRLTTTASGNTLVGVYASPTTKLTGATVARVRLNGISV